MTPEQAPQIIGWHTELPPTAPQVPLPEAPPLGVLREALDTSEQRLWGRTFVWQAHQRLQLSSEPIHSLPPGMGHWVYETPAASWPQVQTPAQLIAWVRHQLGQLLPYQPLAEAARQELNAFLLAKPHASLPIFLAFTLEDENRSLLLDHLPLPQGGDLIGFSLGRHPQP